MENKLFIIIILTITFCITASEAATKKSLFGGVYKLFNLFDNNNTTKTIEEMTVDELGVSRGQCNYNFLPYVGYEDLQNCHIDDEFILHLLPSAAATESQRKPPIMVKCLPEHPLGANHTNKMLVMRSFQDIVELLKPIGNNTKRYQAGSCVLAYFYTPFSFSCLYIGQHINYLPYAFKTLPVAAIDAYEFHSFNTEFGIIALPTLMLFHQGRPVVKYRGQGDINKFVTQHTGLKPSVVPKQLMSLIAVMSELPTKVGYRTDIVLILSWIFILSCAGFYFSKSQLFKKIVEIIKRNWRESEAQLEHN